MRINGTLGCLALLLCACSTNTSIENQKSAVVLPDSSSSNDAAVCEVMYAAHPHNKAIEAVGEQRLQQTQAFDFADMTAFTRAFLPMTAAIADDVVRASGDSLRVLGQELVLGGYEGETIPSVVLRTEVQGDAGYAALITMAAHIGYVYAQDSTLVICADEAVENWQRVISIELVDNGEEKFLTEDNVPLFFGMMIGASNGPEELGYTFYKESKTFSTFAESNRDAKEESVIEELSAWLTEISNGDVELAISTRPLWIFFPHNHWQAEPNGASYLRYMESGKVSPALLQRRQQYLQDFDEFLSQKKQ